MNKWEMVNGQKYNMIKAQCLWLSPCTGREMVAGDEMGVLWLCYWCIFLRIMVKAFLCINGVWILLIMTHNKKYIYLWPCIYTYIHIHMSVYTYDMYVGMCIYVCILHITFFAHRTQVLWNNSYPYPTWYAFWCFLFFTLSLKRNAGCHPLNRFLDQLMVRSPQFEKLCYIAWRLH